AIEKNHDQIQWNADVTVYSGPAPELVIGPDGRVVRAVNVTVNGVANPAAGTDLSGAANISVGDIATPVPSQIVFDAPTSITGGTQVGGHMWGTFHVNDGYQSVRIINASDRDLVLHSMNLAPAGGASASVLQVSAAPSLTYATVQGPAPTIVE